MIITKYNTGKPLIQKSILEYNPSLYSYSIYYNGRELGLLYRSHKGETISCLSSNKKAIDHAFFNYIMRRFRKNNKPLSLY